MIQPRIAVTLVAVLTMSREGMHMNHTEPNVDKGPDNINFRLRKSAAPLILAISTLCLLLSAALTSFAAATTTISGIVKTSAGQPVRGSVTLHDISTPRVSGQTPLDRQFASKSDGTFSIPEVPAGKYQICLGAPQMNLLDPCIWSAAPQVADTSKGTNVSGLTIVADTGTLQVHVNDPDSMLPAPKGGSAGQTLSVTTTARSGRQVRFSAPENNGFGVGLLPPGAVRSDDDAGCEEFRGLAKRWE